MLKFLFRLVLLAVVVIAVAFYFGFGRSIDVLPTSPPGGAVDSAKQTGAEIAGRVSDGAARAGKALSETTLTSKIRSKMLLDDTIDASHINVDTAGTIVTVSGWVGTKAEWQRVVQLARETAGVTSVVDQVKVKAR